MKTALSKRRLLNIVNGSKLTDQDRKSLIRDMLKSGEVSENDIAQMMLDDIELNWKSYRKMFDDDVLLGYIWEHFKDRPLYLARALVQARPDIFYTVGFAFRLILKLRADLGQVTVRPGRPGRGGSTPQEPIKGFEDLITPKILALDVESRFRDMLYYFSRSFKDGMDLLEDEIHLAKTPHDRKVYTAVGKLVETIMKRQLPGVVKELDGHPFPAMHVRWWIEQAFNQTHVLNMGDTGTFKTSYAAIDMRLHGCKRVLVITPAHARDNNWPRELPRYFVKPPKVQVIERKKDLADLDPKAEFTIVSYNLLAQCGTVAALLTGKFDGLIQDECHYAKGVDQNNPGCIEDAIVKRAFACMQLVKQLPLKRFIALSATPWENKPEEIAALATALRPDAFPEIKDFFTSGAARQPRFLRELFADQVLEIETREITDLPPIDPKPWVDLFGAVPLGLCPAHRRIYEAVYFHEEELEPSQKVMRLLMAATHPRLLKERMEFPSDVAPLLDDWRSSTKLAWIKEFVEKRIATEKIVVMTGLYAEGITHGEDEHDTEHVAALFREWFGAERVLVLDGDVPLHGNKNAPHPRQQVIDRWRTDPEARVLLLSVQACPDSVNLSVKTGPEQGVHKLAITALSFGWKPWKQPLGRFWRQGLDVPIEYRIPIIMGTIDENLLRMNQRKWQAQMLFRALAPMTDDEMKFLRNGGTESLAELLRDSSDYVNMTHAMLRGAGEDMALRSLGEQDGPHSRGRALAQHFLAIQDYSASGHIARLLTKTIRVWQEAGLVALDKILDAGCGPLTLERYLDYPVVGLDYNPDMIKLGSENSPHKGARSRVGKLSEMPADWTGRFELTLASLVLDLGSLITQKNGVPERLWILNELVRVTHPHGLVVLTWNAENHTLETFESWKEQIAKSGMLIREEHTGLTSATDNPEQPFSFWCLVFSPNGKVSNLKDIKPFCMANELVRRKVIRGGGKQLQRQVIRKTRVQHHQFEIQTDKGSLDDARAAKDTMVSEVKRLWSMGNAGRTLHRSPEEIATLLGFDWRMWKRAAAHGVATL